mgnify:CR=1 FL=1
MATEAQKKALTALYAGYFDRAPDPAGLQFWINQIDNGRAFNTIAADFAASAEATALYPYLTAPDVATSSTFITSVYQNLFNRAPDAEGLAFWKGVLEAKSVSVADMIEAIINGAKDAPTATPATFDKATLDNKVEAGLDFAVDAGNTSGFTYDADAKVAATAAIAGVTNDPATVTAAKAATDAYLTGSATVGQTLTLTTGVDNIAGTAQNDTINAYINTTAASTTSTLTSADIVDGGAGVDSLKVVVEGTPAGSLPNTSISNVEKFFIRDVAGTASTYNFAPVVGETEVWADTATNAVTFSNLGTGTAVGLKGNGVLTNLGNVNFSMATATDAVTVAIDGGVKNTVAPTITNNGTNASATAATIASTGAANTVGAVTLTTGTGNNGITALTVNAATDLTAALQATDYAATAKMTVTGAGKVNLGAGFDGATIDASANSGGLTVSTTAGVTKALTGSSAADSVTVVGALAANATVNLGAGDDKLLAGGGASVPSTATVDGGAGVDTVAASMLNAGNGSKFVNFEKIDVSAATAAAVDVELLTGSTITGLTMNGGAGGATLTNVAAGVGLSVSGSNTGTTTIGVKGATAATSTTDAFAVSFDGKAAAAATATAPTAIDAGELVLAGVETINVASTGTGFVANNLEIDGATALKKLVITGDKKLDLDFSQDVANNGAVVTATNGLGVAEIDGSAATGVLDINTANIANIANAGLTVKTGAGKDMITLAQKATVEAGAGADVITTAAAGGKLTGGAGNDEFDVSLSLATGTTEATSVLTSIMDFTKGDKIDFGANASGAFQTSKVDVGAATNLDQALGLAIDAANEVAWFQFAGNTYVVADTDGAVGSGGFNAGDTVVKLAGTLDLSTSTFAGTELTFA